MANGPTEGAPASTAPADTGSGGASESTGASSSTATSEASGGGAGTTNQATDTNDDVSKLRSDNEELRRQLSGIVKERNALDGTLIAYELQCRG